MHGLSTINRLLGKKNKEATRSTSNLSKSTNSLDTSSQHNKISPIVNNAPFEQTFRVTVYLPKKQLYVERIGAKTKLGALMDKVCENKLLTPDKYEFRHPGDMSQTFDNDKTIGEVGLNELKLVLKTESRFNSDFHRFHADDMLKYKSSVPDSVSSSEISRNYGKIPTQKASPYSSTTSLNSLDSTGMNLTAKTQPPVAPARKKRAAPRPPSQNSIPEQEIFGTTLNVFKEPHSILPRKNFHVSSPQLNNNALQERRSDKNNNIENGNRLNAITRPTSLYVTSTTDINQNGSARQRSPSESSEVQQILHERQNSNSLEKKKKPAPVPPKRVSKPVPSPRTVQEESKPPTITEIKEIDEQEIVQRDNKVDHVHSGNISKTMLNNVAPADELGSVESSDGPISIQIVSSDSSMEHVKDEPTQTSSPKLPAVSKVHINPEEERRSSSEDEMTVNIYNVMTKSVVTLEKQSAVTVSSSVEETKRNVVVSNVVEKKQTPVVSQIEKQQREVVGSNHVEQTRSSVIVTSSVEKQNHVTVQKQPSPPVVQKQQSPPVVQKQASPPPQQKQASPSVVQKQASPPPLQKQQTPSPVETKRSTVIVAAIEKKQSPKEEPRGEPVVRQIPVEIEQRSPSPLWTYTLPAPPVFADSSVVDKVSPTDHHRKTGDKYYSDFASTDCNETILSDSNTTVISAETQIHPIIVDRKPSVESFIISSKEFTQVADDGSDKSTEIITSDLEDGYLGNGNVEKVDTPPPAESNRMEKEVVVDEFKRSRLLIARSDSFHSIGQGRNFDAGAKRNPMGSPQRSTSFLSLVQAQKAEQLLHKSTNDNGPYSRQKSTSELSISEGPSLQSVEVLKNILNSSRKNSLQDASPKEEKVVTLSRQVSPIEVLTKKIEEVARKPERQTSEPAVESKPVETQWRYTGPPKVNLSTWNERAKVDVAIAADRDYKFGNVSATLPRDFRNQQDAASKRHTIHIPDERVVKDEPEVSTKPKVLGVEYKKDVSPVQVREQSAEIVTKPTRTIINIKPRPMSMDLSNNYAQLITSTTPSNVSYNRLNSNAKKFHPVVHGFKLNNIKESDQVDSASVPAHKRDVEHAEKRAMGPPSVPAKPSFLRSTSAGDINRKMTFSAVPVKQEEELSSLDLPFSQTGLRRTGLKDKILLSDRETKSMFGKVVELKQESFIRIHQYQEPKPVEKFSVRSLSSPAPVPPKPPTAPPMMNFRKSEPVSMETRDELLDAIKNFKKDSLRHK